MLVRQFDNKNLLFLPVIVVYGAMALLPIAMIVRLSFETGLAPFQKLFSSPLFWPVAANTVSVGLYTTAISIFLGYILAALLWRSSGFTRLAVLGFVLLPFWTAVLIKNFAWAILLQDNGAINSMLIWLGLTDRPLPLLYNRFAVVVGMVHYTIPYAVLPIFTAMLAIDDRLERAARSLGATSRESFYHVILPLTLPGVYSAALLVFIISIGFYVTPIVLGGPRQMMIANLVQFYSQQIIDFNTAAALSLIILVSSGLLIALFQLLPKEGQFGRA
ncbi:ABC transporter permease [Mesorhizobium sp. L-8-10]|uniref:ABC transporter permease n=1 Tax=Mesorhizobium sp. L-8-10 TaxID=2744523 RepID=UPI001937E86E|nr:ABC transporter permease [Mesorhizobium sp. L-8-10]BCH29896.1 ABC transporter permease [Mesorhizobium sp. L-8-10]